MQRQRFDGVVAKTACLGLQSRGDEGLQRTLLTLDRTNFHLQSRGIVTSEGGQEKVSILLVEET